MYALRNIHRALAPYGVLVDTQPVSVRAPVEADGARLGSLDMRQWLDTIDSVDERVAEAIAGGLYELQHEQRFAVIDTFDNGRECLEQVSSWCGTRVSSAVATRLTAATSRVTVQQEVRLRLLVCRDQS